MENLKIEVEETKTYWERMKYPLIGGFVISASWLLIVYLQRQKMHDPIWIGIVLWLLVLAVYIWGCDTTCAYYVTTLEISENRVYIIYKKRNESYELDDSLEKFVFKKGINRAGSYFKIKCNGNLLLSQYKKWKWKEEAFNKTMTYLTKRNLVAINWFQI